MDGESHDGRTEIVQPPETVVTLSSAEANASEEGPVVVEVGKLTAEEQQQEEAVRKGEAVDGGGAVRGSEKEKGSSVVVDLRCELEGVSGGGGRGDRETEKECRICHVSSDRREGAAGSDLIQLGCGCKGELGIAHRYCAETWFKLKGNRCCEICGVSAKNITGIEDYNFMEEWNERTLDTRHNSNSSDRSRCWRGQPFCNFLMACLVIAFILPWFFRVNMF